MRPYNSSLLVAFLLSTLATGRMLAEEGTEHSFRHKSNPESLWGLEAFEIEVRAHVTASDSEKRSLASRVYTIRALLDGERYRIECDSEGDEIGILPRLLASFDGLESALALPMADVVVLRAGDITDPLFFPIPDPITLQARALDSLDAPSRSFLLTLREISSDPGKRALLSRRASELAAAGRSFSSGSTRVVDNLELEGGRARLELTGSGEMWYPSGFSLTSTDATSASSSWAVQEFIPPSEADGVRGIPRRVLFEASDPTQESFPRVSIQYEVTSFKLRARPSPEEFRLDQTRFLRIYDNDSKVFIKR